MGFNSGAMTLSIMAFSKALALCIMRYAFLTLSIILIKHWRFTLA